MTDNTWFLVEEESTACPNLNVGDIPGFAFQFLDVSARGETIWVKPRGYVGNIPTTNGGQLQIRPKFGAAAYLEMLLAVRGNSITSSEQRQTYDSGSGRTPEEISAHAFARSLLPLYSDGLRHERRIRDVRDTHWRGSLNIRKTALAIAAKSARPVYSHESYKSSDTAEHRVISAAAEMALRFVMPDGVEYQLLSQWLRSHPTVASQADLFRAQSDLASGRFARARGYYVEAISLALVILGLAGLTTGGVRMSSDCVLVYMPGLFEDYVRKQLGLCAAPLGLAISKGALHTLSLYEGGDFELNPDICVYRGQELVAIADAKYKSPDSKDHYQMIAYARRYRATKVFFLSPRREKHAAKHWRTEDGIEVADVQLNLHDVLKTKLELSSMASQLASL